MLRRWHVASVADTVLDFLLLLLPVERALDVSALGELFGRRELHRHAPLPSAARLGWLCPCSI